METEITNWENLLAMQKSPGTVRSYVWEIRALYEHCPKDKPQDYTLDDLTAYSAGRQARYLASSTKRGEKLSNAAVKRMVWAFKSFFGHTCKEQSPAAGLVAPSVPKRIQRVLDEQQALDVLVGASEGKRPMRAARDLAIVALMLDSGIRCAEVCRLRVDKFFMERREFFVIIKGGDEERGSFTDATANILAAWLAYREKIARPDVPNLFLATGGTWWDAEGKGHNARGRALTTDGLRTIFGKIADRSGLENLSPHDLRRTFADLLVQNGASINELQAAGRWKSRQQAEDYLRHSHRRRQDKFLPVGKLLGG